VKGFGRFVIGLLVSLLVLVAVALLFSIYQVKPSPFCVLDELDAPLDESNINRFIRVLQRFLVLIKMPINGAGISDARPNLAGNHFGCARQFELEGPPLGRSALKHPAEGLRLLVKVILPKPSLDRMLGQRSIDNLETHLKASQVNNILCRSVRNHSLQRSPFRKKTVLLNAVHGVPFRVPGCYGYGRHGESLCCRRKRV